VIIYLLCLFGRRYIIECGGKLSQMVIRVWKQAVILVNFKWLTQLSRFISNEIRSPVIWISNFTCHVTEIQCLCVQPFLRYCSDRKEFEHYFLFISTNQSAEKIIWHAFNCLCLFPQTMKSVHPCELYKTLLQYSNQSVAWRNSFCWRTRK
jgi:hypothetical protein